MKKIFIFFLFCVKGIFAQDAVFTLPGSGTAYMNAALVDYNTVSTFKSSYRLQWPKLDGGWSQYYGEYSHYIHSIRGHITVYGLFENNYASSRQCYFLNYTQDIKISKQGVLRVFFGGGYFRRKIDWSVLAFGDMIDPRGGFLYATNDVPRGGTVSNVDFNTGLGGKLSFLTFGLAVSHLTQPDQSVVKGKSPLPMKFSFQLGADYDFLISRQGKLKTLPYFMIEQQGTVANIQYGSAFEIKGYRLGIYSRRKDAVCFAVGYNHKYFGINLGYDYTTSSLKGLTGGSYELNIGLKMGRDVRQLQKLKFDAPFVY